MMNSKLSLAAMLPWVLTPSPSVGSYSLATGTATHTGNSSHTKATRKSKAKRKAQKLARRRNRKK
jgi:hypothetical protein